MFIIHRWWRGPAVREETVGAAPEENVYYISLAEIQKRKVRVSDLPAFVADKTMAYYEEEFDASGDC